MRRLEQGLLGESDPCNDGACRSSHGACIKRPKADGTGCNADNTDCTVGDSCQNGACTPGAGVDCSTQSDPCNTGVCRQSDGQYQATQGRWYGVRIRTDVRGRRLRV